MTIKFNYFKYITDCVQYNQFYTYKIILNIFALRKLVSFISNFCTLKSFKVFRDTKIIFLLI